MIARAVVGDADQAEDVCQDALIRIWERIDDCREPERFGAWLGRAVHRHSLNAIRGRRETVEVGPDLPEPGPAADRRVEAREDRDRLDRALRRLSREQREAVLLFDLEGWSHAEIAGLLGTSEAMSRQHLMLGRRRLRQLLEPREDLG